MLAPLRIKNEENNHSTHHITFIAILRKVSCAKTAINAASNTIFVILAQRCTVIIMCCCHQHDQLLVLTSTSTSSSSRNTLRPSVWCSLSPRCSAAGAPPSWKFFIWNLARAAVTRKKKEMRWREVSPGCMLTDSTKVEPLLTLPQPQPPQRYFTADSVQESTKLKSNKLLPVFLNVPKCVTDVLQGGCNYFTINYVNSFSDFVMFLFQLQGY